MATKTRIRRLVMEVEISSEKDFESLNQEAKDFVNRNLLDLIQELVNELNPDIDYIIDSIEIDLGKINFQSLHSIMSSFSEQFRKQLSYKKASSKVSESFKFENALLQFIDQGTLPWWLDQTDGLKGDLSKKKFSQPFLDKIKSLLMVSKVNFFRLQNFLDHHGLDHFLKQILKKNHSFYRFSLRLMEQLSEKTKHKWIGSNFNKKVLQHLLVSGFSVSKPDKKQILLSVLKKFAEQTGQNIDELFAISLTQTKDKNAEFNQVLSALSEENKKSQTPQNLTSMDASSILMSYLENGFDELPPGYADSIVLDGLLQMVLEQYEKQFLQQIKSLDLNDAPLVIQRLLSLFNRSKVSPAQAFLTDVSYSSFSEIISFLKSSQMINLLERQKISSDNESLNISILKFILQQEVSGLSNQSMLEQFLKTLALDFGLAYPDLIQEVFLSFKPVKQQQQLVSYLEKIYNQEVVSKYDYKLLPSISGDKAELDPDLKLNLFQRESFHYFTDLLIKPPFSDLLAKRFDPPENLLIFIAEEIQKIQGADFGDLTIKLLTAIAQKTVSDLSDWVENTIRFINPKIPKDSFDHQILAKLTREQYSQSKDDDIQLTGQSTLFRYQLVKELTLLQEDTVVLFLSRYDEFVENAPFRRKFSSPMEFEKFLVDDLHGSSVSDLDLLIENIFSKITIVTKLSYTKTVNIVMEGLAEKKEKTYFEIALIRKYKPSLSESFSKKEQSLESDQDHLTKKGLSFDHRKMILFLFQHLDRLSNTQSFKRVFATRKKLLDFLAQDFRSFSSNYEMHANLMDRLASKLKTSYNRLVDEVIASINSKTKKSSLDYEFIAFFDSQGRKAQVDPAQEKMLYAIVQKQDLSIDYQKIKAFQLFFKVFQYFKNKKNYNKAYPTDVDLAHFLSEQFKIHSNKNFEEQVDLFFESFGQSAYMSLSYLFVFSIEKLLLKQYTDELSNRLLSKMIVRLMEINQPKFSFGANASSFKNIDDLSIKMASLNKVYPSQFLQLIYYPKAVAVLKPGSFIKMILNLADDSKINPLWIDKDLNHSIENAKGTLKERIRFVLLKILLDSKSIKTQQDFLKSIEEHLLRHDPKIIEKGIINTEFKEVVPEDEETKASTIKKIVDLLSGQKEQFVSPLEESSFELNQFEYLLQYKNDILVTNDQVNSNRIQKELDNFELIISSSESLLFFFKTYTQDLELLLSFTELGLTKEYKRKVNQRIDQLSKKFLVLEKRLTELQNSFRFSNLENNTFKILLRALIFKNIGRYKTAENFNIGDFTYGFFEHLSRERYLNIRAVNEIPTTKESDSIRLEIHRALNVFTDRGSYFGISKKIRDEVYFKDLSLAVLRHGQLPEWALSETFTAEDAWGYVISKIENLDFDFTSKFITSLPMSDGFLEAIADKPLKFYTSLFQQIQTSSMGYDLGLKFQELVNYFSNNPWNSKDDVLKVLSQFVLREAVWRSNSLIQFARKLHDLLTERTDISPSKLKDEIDTALGMSTSFTSFKKSDSLSPEDKIEAIRYFVELGRFPENYKGEPSSIKKKLSFVLNESSLQVKQLLRSYLNRPDAVNNILNIISKQELIKITRVAFFQETDQLIAIGEALFSALNKQTDATQKLPLFFKLIHQHFIEKGFKEGALKDFFASLHNEDQAFYSSVVKEFLMIKKSDKWDAFSAQAQFLSGIDKIDDLTLSLQPRNIDLERSEYYVEFGSTKFDDVLLSMSDLYSIFQKLADQDELLIKKRLHQWGNSKNKIRRILKLYPENNIKSLFDFIHPDLASFLDALDSVLIKQHNSSLPMALGLDHWEGVIIYSFGYWSSKNLILYSLKDLIQMFLTQIFNQLGISKEDFIAELKDATLKTSNVVKQSLIDWTLQLDARPSENQIKDSQAQEFNDLDGVESLLVENAGLVLLWPFLSRLFDKLNLMEKRDFVDNESQQKAILLTEYLVSGKTEFQESFLTLNKIICGAAPDMFVDINLPLEKFELELCESLLNSVIKNWEKIENSSISTLRESFLLREGALSKFGSDFNLNIQKKPFDVLLDTLPWNISMIQTSFMKNRILVDWI